jgi:hypothetical protein
MNVVSSVMYDKLLANRCFWLSKLLVKTDKKMMWISCNYVVKKKVLESR